MYKGIVQLREATFHMNILENIYIRTIQHVGALLYIQIILAI
jgi:hypothetical protein